MERVAAIAGGREKANDERVAKRELCGSPVPLATSSAFRAAGQEGNP
jgi:hypothetical protein